MLKKKLARNSKACKSKACKSKGHFQRGSLDSELWRLSKRAPSKKKGRPTGDYGELASSIWYPTIARVPDWYYQLAHVCSNNVIAMAL